jgi:hypothetical protein
MSADTNSATLELIELVDQVKNLVAPDGHSNFARCETLLDKHHPLISDPCQALKFANTSGSTATQLQLWRQGNNLPLEGGLMRKQINCLKELRAGGAFMTLSPENKQIRDKYFQNWTPKQIESKLAALDGKVPFVEKSVAVLNNELKKLQKNLSSDGASQCDLSVCIDLWVDAHKALWNPNSEIRSKLETYLGQRLEAYLNIGGLGSAAKLVGWYWPTSSGYRRPIRVDIHGYHDQRGKPDEEIYQYQKEIELEMILATRIAYLQREMALAIVKDLMGVRTAISSDNEHNEAENSAPMGVNGTNGTNGTKENEDQEDQEDQGDNLLTMKAIQIIFTYTNKLLFPVDSKPKNGLPMKLMEAVPQLMQDVRGTGIRKILASNVLKDVGRCLFVIFYSTQITKVELLLLAKTIDAVRDRMYSTLHGEVLLHGLCTDHVLDRIQEHELFNVAVLLLLTYVCAVDPALKHKLLRRWNPQKRTQIDRRPEWNNVLFQDAASDGDPLYAEMFNNNNNNVNNVNNNSGGNGGSSNSENKNPFTAIMKMSWLLIRTCDEEKSKADYEQTADEMKSLLELRPFTFLNKLLNYNGIKHDGKNRERDRERGRRIALLEG